MFRLRPEGAAAAAVVVTVEGRPVRIAKGASAASAMLSAGLRSFRETPMGTERAAYCMTGVCFDCLAEIDGVPNRVSCMIEVCPGMRIRRQSGARRIGPVA
jgi:D-hydroxyproline dehydrogenase subunit gamma